MAMASNTIQCQPFRLKLKDSITFTCACLVLILGARLATAAQNGSIRQSVVAEGRASIERTSNVIPEADESGLDTLAKYLVEKQQQQSISSAQLEKPYHYQARLEGASPRGDDSDSIRPRKRSGAARATLNVSLSVAEATTTIASPLDEQQSETLSTEGDEPYSSTSAGADKEPTSTTAQPDSTTVESSSEVPSTQPPTEETLPPSTTEEVATSTTSADLLDESTTVVTAEEELHQPTEATATDRRTEPGTGFDFSRAVVSSEKPVSLSSTTATLPTSLEPWMSSSTQPYISSSSSTETYGTMIQVSTWKPEDRTVEGSREAGSSPPTMSIDDVTLLVRIVVEGDWQDVCSNLPLLRRSLAELVNASADQTISSDQVIFHQVQCSDNLLPSSTPTQKAVLTPLLVYLADKNGKPDEALTKILPSLYEKSPFNFPLPIHSFEMIQEVEGPGSTIIVIIVSCVVVISLILLAILLFIMRKRQGHFNYGERCRPVSLDAYSLDSVSAYSSVRRNKAAIRSSKRSYGNPTFEDSTAVPSHPLNLAGLSLICNDASAVAEEFAGIPQVSPNIDELPPGAELKNRYANVIPLPETRVLLQMLDNDPLSEYINASYVRGSKNSSKYYIACQAPTENTVNDFWRMIWEQQCKVIIMLTDLVENGVEKCTEYIPPLEVSDCHRLYGDYQVTLKKREAREKYAISSLHLKNLENNTFREVLHIWYLWPTNGVPSDAAALIAVLLESRAFQRASAGPMLIHCSPGTGRTGTLIALDLCIRQYEMTRTIDVPRVVYTIRRDRAGAVQTRDQYAFIYQGLNFYANKLAGGSIETI